jgi:hypothetical protein
VEYSALGDAVAANNALQGIDVAGSVLKVAFEAPAPPPLRSQLGAPRTVSSASRGGAAGTDDAPEVPTSCLWVGLPGGCSVTEADLRSAFSACQGMTRVKAFPDRNYGFVSFTTTGEAAAAKAVLNNRVVGDARLTIKYALNPGGPSSRPHNQRGGPQTQPRSDRSPRSPSRDRPPRLDSLTASDGYVRLSGSDVAALLGAARQPPLTSARLAASDAHAAPSPAATPPAALITPWSDPRRSADAPSPDLPPDDVPPWQGVLGKCGVPVCRLTAVRGSTAALPSSLDCSARSDLAPLGAYLRATPFTVAELAPATRADCAPLGAFLASLGELQRAGVVRGAGSLIFLVPPCEWAGLHLHCAPTANLLAVSTAAPEAPAG